MYSKFTLNGNPIRIGMAANHVKSIYGLSDIDAVKVVKMIRCTQGEIIDLFTKQRKNPPLILQNRIMTETLDEDIYNLKLAGIDVEFNENLFELKN